MIRVARVVKPAVEAVVAYSSRKALMQEAEYVVDVVRRELGLRAAEDALSAGAGVEEETMTYSGTVNSSATCISTVLAIQEPTADPKGVPSCVTSTRDRSPDRRRSRLSQTKLCCTKSSRYLL